MKVFMIGGALLLAGLNVERDIHKEQEEILLRKAAG